MTFREALAEQRWDDHRFYHHNRVNQSLHFVSALGFLCAYVFLFIEPAVSVMIAWLFSMPTRQAGHFFFEPHNYDEANQVTHEYKEEVKVGYNLYRKVWLMSIWAVSPLVLYFDASLFGLLTPHQNAYELAHNIAIMWLWIGIGGVLFRTVQLFFLKDVQTGLVWCVKIVTDPLHDVKLYSRAPLHLMRGEMFDPIVTREAA